MQVLSDRIGSSSWAGHPFQYQSRSALLTVGKERQDPVNSATGTDIGPVGPGRSKSGCNILLSRSVVAPDVYETRRQRDSVGDPQ